MKKFNREEFEKATVRMDDIDESIQKEIHDRVIETDEAVDPVRNYLHSKHTYN
jgi:hypothetical protein